MQYDSVAGLSSFCNGKSTNLRKTNVLSQEYDNEAHKKEEKMIFIIFSGTLKIMKQKAQENEWKTSGT